MRDDFCVPRFLGYVVQVKDEGEWITMESIYCDPKDRNGCPLTEAHTLAMKYECIEGRGNVRVKGGHTSYIYYPDPGYKANWVQVYDKEAKIWISMDNLMCYCLSTRHNVCPDPDKCALTVAKRYEKMEGKGYVRIVGNYLINVNDVKWPESMIEHMDVAPFAAFRRHGHGLIFND